MPEGEDEEVPKPRDIKELRKELSRMTDMRRRKRETFKIEEAKEKVRVLTERNAYLRDTNQQMKLRIQLLKDQEPKIIRKSTPNTRPEELCHGSYAYPPVPITTLPDSTCTSEKVQAINCVETSCKPQESQAYANEESTTLTAEESPQADLSVEEALPPLKTGMPEQASGSCEDPKLRESRITDSSRTDRSESELQKGNPEDLPDSREPFPRASSIPFSNASSSSGSPASLSFSWNTPQVVSYSFQACAGASTSQFPIINIGTPSFPLGTPLFCSPIFIPVRSQAAAALNTGVVYIAPSNPPIIYEQTCNLAQGNASICTEFPYVSSTPSTLHETSSRFGAGITVNEGQPFNGDTVAEKNEPPPESDSSSGET